MIHKELIDFLKNDETRIIFSKISTFQKKVLDVQNASDFDVYSALCENIYLLSFHHMQKKFLNLLSLYSNSDIESFYLCDLDYRKKLWQKIFSEDNIELPLPEMNFEKNAYLKNSENILLLNTAIVNNFDDIYELLQNTLENITNNGIDSIIFDARNINFLRPDDFHAQKAYEAFKFGNGDISIVSLWLLCRILMNTGLPLILKVDSENKAEDMLELIFRISSPVKIIISIDISKMIDYNKILDILMRNYKKNISLEVCCSKENINKLFEFFKVVPILFVERINGDIDEMKDIFASTISEFESEHIISHLSLVK